MRPYLALVLIVIVAVAQSAIVRSQPAAQRSIDAARSKAQFTVTHVFVEHVTGNIPIQSGSVVLKVGSLIPVSATAVLDATGVTTGDPDRDASLRSPDFFETAKFPTWSFVSTKIVPHGDTGFEMDGKLTIHGVAQPERLDVTASGDSEHPIYHATAQIDRHAFGMATTRLDPAIGGTAAVTLDVTLQ